MWISGPQAQLRVRDVEIHRLGSRAGANADVSALLQRNESHEAMILQLNSTVRRVTISGYRGQDVRAEVSLSSEASCFIPDR